MKKQRIIFAIGLLVCGLGWGAETLPDNFDLGKGSVLIELFTSEGCSSCPPTEKVFQNLADEAEAKGHAIHYIAWHVDYWDRLRTAHGVWKDPYSSPQATRRQRYSMAMTRLGIAKRPMLVTPQAFVNGRPYRHLRGQKLSTPEILKKMSEDSGGIEVNAKLTRADNKVTVDWELDGEARVPRINLTIVAVESDLHSDVGRGENAGKRFIHTHVVRAVSTHNPEEKTGKATLTLPGDWQGKAGAVLIIVQDKQLLLREVKRIPIDVVEGADAAASTMPPDPIADAISKSGVCTPDGCTTVSP